MFDYCYLCNYKIPLVGQRRDAKGVNSLMQPASECVKVVDFYLQSPLTCLPTQNVIEPSYANVKYDEPRHLLKRSKIMAVALKKEVKFTYDDYLVWDIGNDKRYELIGGEFFMAPAPNTWHQSVSRDIEFKIACFLENSRLGKVFYAPYDVVLSNEDVVQPDIIFVSKENRHIITQDNIKGSPDLLIEIISKNSAQRDRIIKRRLYEKYGVHEYWLVDMDKKEIEVLVLTKGTYEIYAVFQSQDTLSSVVLKELHFKVEEVFDMNSN